MRTIVQLVALEGQVRTSLVRTLEGIFAAAADAGWRRVIALPAGTVGATWVSEMAASGVEIRAAPTGDLTEWARGLSDEAPGPVVLHSHFTSYDIAAARAAASSDRAVAIWHIHTVLGRSPPMVARHMAKLALARRLQVAAIVCPSEPMASALRRRGAPPNRLHVFRSAIDLDAFPVLDARSRSGAREALGLPPDATVLLHFGWDWKLKGGDRFLAAIAALRLQGVNALGLARADPAVQRHIDDAGLQEWVRVEHPRELSQLFGVADALMATSRGEGLPFTVLEAMAMGVPVVATDIRGHRIFRGAPLCAVVPADGAHLADAVRSLPGPSSAPGRSQAAEARAWLAEHFSLDGYVARMLDLYDSVLDRGPGRKVQEPGGPS